MPIILKPSKSAKNKNNIELVAMDDVEKEAKSLIQRILGDVSKTSASKQIVLGASSGWVTGYLAMRVGKVAALALGGGIILLQVANEKGYINVNWDKVSDKVNKATTTVEDTITGVDPTWTSKAERYIDRKLNKVEDSLKKTQKKVKKWYSQDNCQLKEYHIFIVSFVAGIAIGIGTS